MSDTSTLESVASETDQEPDHVEKVERTDHGYRLKIESTRGTGTRNEDTVKGQIRTETLDQLEDERDKLVEDVVETLNELRSNQPDHDDDQ